MKIKYPGMAPTPKQLEKLREISREANPPDIEEDGGASPQLIIEQAELPIVGMSAANLLRQEVTQIVWGTHWEYQKRILDHIEAVVQSDRQWTVLRRILMAIMTEQVERTRLLVGQRIRQEAFVKEEIKDDRRTDEPRGTVEAVRPAADD